VVRRFNIYATDHINSQTVCRALSKGTGFPSVAPTPLREGGVITYGILRGTLTPLEAARAEGRPWAYVDRGYFRSTYGSDFSGYFRITRNAFQHDGRGEFSNERWVRLALRILPWRRGRHILVCPPGEAFTQSMLKVTAKQWLDDTLAKLGAHTDRPIQVRYKPPIGKEGRTLADDLQDCHALVTHMSNTSVEALLAGIPVFTTGKCAATYMGQRDLALIETPVYPDDRERWARALAANQWTLAEMQSGAANHLFREA
jgi:hypothetical protein